MFSCEAYSTITCVVVEYSNTSSIIQAGIRSTKISVWKTYAHLLLVKSLSKVYFVLHWRLYCYVVVRHGLSGDYTAMWLWDMDSVEMGATLWCWEWSWIWHGVKYEVLYRKRWKTSEKGGLRLAGHCIRQKELKASNLICKSPLKAIQIGKSPSWSM